MAEAKKKVIKEEAHKEPKPEPKPEEIKPLSAIHNRKHRM